MATKKLYYSMGEVAEMFDVTPALIRHWESQFDCIKPHRNKKGNRLFSPNDVEKLKQIYHLVKEKGMTLKGANKVLKRGSKDGATQEMELLERLQKIRATLVQVREELKEDDGECLFSNDDTQPEEPIVAQIEDPVVEDSGLEQAAAEQPEVVEASEAVSEVALEAADQQPESIKEPESESGSESESTEESAADEVEESEDVVSEELENEVSEEPERESEQESVSEPLVGQSYTVEQPKKRVVRRKKRADEEDKELFPFYEQSLF